MSDLAFGFLIGFCPLFPIAAAWWPIVADGRVTVGATG
jgi:hypothetical protein